MGVTTALCVLSVIKIRNLHFTSSTPAPSRRKVWYKLRIARPVCCSNLPGNLNSIQQWWTICSQSPKEQAAAAAYIAWHIWNEQNRRVFTAKSISADGVISMIKAVLDLMRVAF